MRLIPLLPAFLLLVACGGDDATAPTTSGDGASTTETTLLLDADLPDAVGVVNAKETLPDEPVAVWGRVRETADGFFTLVDDEAVAPCLSEEEMTCETPWDYCCEDQAYVREVTIVVEANDAAGNPVPRDALGLRPLDVVAVHGKVAEDDAGAVVLTVDKGYFLRQRPDVGDDVTFP